MPHGTLTYKGGILSYRDPDPLPLAGESFTLVKASDGGADLAPIMPPEPYPVSILADVFTYQAKDEGGLLSNKADVTVVRDFYDYIA